MCLQCQRYARHVYPLSLPILSCLSCEKTVTREYGALLLTYVDEGGVLWLVTDFGGIPLSGTNRTTFVSEDGRRDMRPIHDFTALWSSY